MTTKQGTVFVAKIDFVAKSWGSRMTVKAGQRFWQTSVRYDENTPIEVCREGKGGIGQGWTFSSMDFRNYFQEV